MTPKWSYTFVGFYKPSMFWAFRIWNNTICKGVQIGPFLWIKQHEFTHIEY